jgi:ATP-dependent helicase HrpA
MTSAPAPHPLPVSATRLAELTISDQHRLRRRVDGASKIKNTARRTAVLAEIDGQILAAEQRIANRRASVPAVRYPEELPVSQRRDDIAAAIRDHQVVIVAGETGSGKTTQIPKICLELGRGVRGLIGHTQPRRIAARTVAERIADELGRPLGDTVGYQVRFTGRVGEQTLVKVMTDGILLAETQHDRMLNAYDTLIIDEAHERSLNIDFLLGYLKQLLPRRPDLKVIITSATIDPERFAEHFGGAEQRRNSGVAEQSKKCGGAEQRGAPVSAPIVEVSGRTYPVEVRYRPLLEQVPSEDEEGEIETDIVRDQIEAICDAVDELSHEAPGDVLVFLSGEREIRDTADALGKRNLPHTEVLPLFARLSTVEQQRIFQTHTGRRIVLATNVAETSLTVPGIRYVVDPGTARVSRYSQRLKVQRLPIEPVSQASANQRKGRCGRTSDGICIRLYSQDDFEARPLFTEPEILRTNLASVVLQMAALDLGDIEAFPFVEPPDRRSINDGVVALQELGAFDAGVKDSRRRLTPLGRKLAQLPVDPRLGRLVLEAESNGCVREVLIITAALSIQDPRERPLDKQQAATEKHARFRDPDSDFVAYLNLWNYLQEQQKELSSSQFRRLCKADFLNYSRVREWQDLESQLRQVVKGLGIAVNVIPAEATRVHISLLAGLLSHIGLKDLEKPEYIGARGGRFAIFPGSTLFRKTPRWVMAAELVETSRLWGRVAARIEPEWAEKLAGHLVKRRYSEPHWEATQGSVVAMEKVTLYGLPLVAARKVQYGRIDPVLSRELFIRHALVEGDWKTHHTFFHDNRALLDEVEELENRARRRDILVDDETLFAFYDERIGAEVVSAQHFDSWWKHLRRAEPDLLNFEKAMLVNERAAGFDKAHYPDVWRQGELELPLTYQFEPGTEADGVTVHVPLPVLNQVSADGFDWQIPGLRQDLVTALIRSLPKSLRRNFVPVPDYAGNFMDSAAVSGPLLDAVEAHLRRLTGVIVPRSAWDLSKVPAHLNVTFRIEGEDGATVAEGKDLPALKRQLAPKSREVVAEMADGVERTGLTAWNPGTLARVVQRRRGGYSVKAYPALVDERDSVAVRVFETQAEQDRAMWAGTRRLLLIEVPTPIPLLSRRLSNQVKLGLTRYPYSNVPDLLEDCVVAAVDTIIDRSGGPSWDEAGYARLREAARADLPDTTVDIVVTVEKIVAAAHEVRSGLGSAAGPVQPSIEDMRAQLVALIQPGFVTATGTRHLTDLPRYLKAIARRLEKLPGNPARDQEWMDQIAEVRAEYDDLLASLPPHRRGEDAVREIRWMIEEFRVSLFAQELRAAYPVSEVRLLRAMDQLR